MVRSNWPGRARNIYDLLCTFARGSTNVLLTGFVIIMPFVLVGILFRMALDFVRSVLQPIIAVLRWGGIIRMANFGVVGEALIKLGVYDDVFGFFMEFIAVLSLLGAIVFLGVFASFHSGRRVVDYVDAGIMLLPGVGPIYKSFRRMGDVILESGLENFRSVKVVEFPREEYFSLAFETNRAPESIRAVTEVNEIVTLFVPLAPNPVMGGFLVHVPEERVFDVDMTVEEAARALITSGIAAGEETVGETPSLNPFHRMKRIAEDDGSHSNGEDDG